MSTQNIYSIDQAVPCPPLKDGQQNLTPAMLSAYIRRSIEQIKYLLATSERDKAISQLDLIRQEIAFLTNTSFERIQDSVQTLPNPPNPPSTT